MKTYHWTRAGFTLLLLFLLTLSAAQVLSTGSLSGRVIQADFANVRLATSVLLTSAGVVLWLAMLRAFILEKLQKIVNRVVLTMQALAMGFGLAGVAAWCTQVLPGDSAPGFFFVVGTLAAALVLQFAAWLLEKRSNEPDRLAVLDTLQPVGATRDYILLTKPIVLALLLVTTLAAMIVAAGELPAFGLLVWTMVGGAFSAGGASALNQYIDRVRDSKMARTRRRPLPDRRLHPNNVILFGILLCVAGFFTLAIFVNLLSALLALAGMVYYIVLYSLLLKQSTTQNIVIGGGAGALPPLVGWAAATGGLSMPAFFLFALVFFWTPPHFWALALLKSRDYARAGVPMLPVIYGADETRWQIMLYTIQLVALTLLLPLARLGEQIYLVAAIVLGAGLVYYAWRLWRQGGNQPAYKMYRYSSTYLALIFAALVVDTFL